MKSRTATVDGKPIEIYDDIFDADERFKLYYFALNKCAYVTERSSTDTPESRSSYKTLKCDLDVPSTIAMGFFENQFVLDYIKKNDLRLQRSYINLGTASDTYQYHTDDYSNTEKNSLTGLYYMNIEWQPNWEGETHFSNNEMKEVFFTSSFVPGRLVLFDATIPHKSSQPSFDSKYFRYTYAIKFTNRTNPDTYGQSLNIEDFIFNTSDFQPTNNERELKALDYISRRTSNLPHSNTTFFTHLYNTYCILKKWGLSSDVCLAGLYHSVYGTEYYNAKLDVNEKMIQSLIGPYANQLVKYFCQPNRDHNILNNAFNLDPQAELDLTYILYANMIEQSLRIHPQHNLFAKCKDKIETIKNIINKV